MARLLRLTGTKGLVFPSKSIVTKFNLIARTLFWGKLISNLNNNSISFMQSSRKPISCDPSHPSFSKACHLFLKKNTNTHTNTDKIHIPQNSLLKCIIQWLLEYLQHCATINSYLIPKHFHHPQKESLTHHLLAVTLHSLLSPGLRTNNLLIRLHRFANSGHFK